MMNYPKILSVFAFILVAMTLISALLLFASSWSGFNTDLIAAAQAIVLALGLSAITLAILRTSYRDT